MGTINKNFTEIRVESKWNTKYKIAGSIGTSKKVALFSRSKCSKRIRVPFLQTHL